MTTKIFSIPKNTKKRLAKFNEFEKQFKEEQEINDWSIKLQRASRKGRLKLLKK